MDGFQRIDITTTVAFTGCSLNVARTEDGGRQLQIINERSGTLYTLDLAAETARGLGSELMSAVAVVPANGIPEAA